MRPLLFSSAFYALLIALVWSLTRSSRTTKDGMRAAWDRLHLVLSDRRVMIVLLLGGAINMALRTGLRTFTQGITFRM